MEDCKSGLRLTPKQEADQIAEDPAGKALLLALNELPPDRVDHLIADLQGVLEQEGRD